MGAGVGVRVREAAGVGHERGVEAECTIVVHLDAERLEEVPRHGAGCGVGGIDPEMRSESGVAHVVVDVQERVGVPALAPVGTHEHP